MDFARHTRAHPEQVGMTTLERTKFGVVTSETYGGEILTMPVAIVSRAPAPPAAAR